MNNGINWIVGLIIIFGCTSCADMIIPESSQYETARIAEQGEVELSGSYGSIGMRGDYHVKSDDEGDNMNWDNYALAGQIGISEKFGLGSNLSLMKAKSIDRTISGMDTTFTFARGNSFNLQVSPKYVIKENILAVSAPLTGYVWKTKYGAFGEEEGDDGVNFSVRPTVMVGYPASESVKPYLNIGASYGFGNENTEFVNRDDWFYSANIGVEVFPGMDNNFLVQPALGFLSAFDEDQFGMKFHTLNFGVKAGYIFE